MTPHGAQRIVVITESERVDALDRRVARGGHEDLGRQAARRLHCLPVRLRSHRRHPVG